MLFLKIKNLSFTHNIDNKNYINVLYVIKKMVKTDI
jgi:hypothetical protein